MSIYAHQTAEADRDVPRRELRRRPRRRSFRPAGGNPARNHTEHVEPVEKPEENARSDHPAAHRAVQGHAGEPAGGGDACADAALHAGTGRGAETRGNDEDGGNTGVLRALQSHFSASRAKF